VKTWTDKFIAELESILDRCESDLRRVLPGKEFERTAREVGTDGYRGVALTIKFDWTKRDAWSFVIKFGTPGYSADASEDRLAGLVGAR